MTQHGDLSPPIARSVQITSVAVSISTVDPVCSVIKRLLWGRAFCRLPDMQPERQLHDRHRHRRCGKTRWLTPAVRTSRVLVSHRNAGPEACAATYSTWQSEYRLTATCHRSASSLTSISDGQVCLTRQPVSQHRYFLDAEAGRADVSISNQS
jgi:hypothetical protein